MHIPRSGLSYTTGSLNFSPSYKSHLAMIEDDVKSHVAWAHPLPFMFLSCAHLSLSYACEFATRRVSVTLPLVDLLSTFRLREIVPSSRQSRSWQ